MLLFKDIYEGDLIDIVFSFELGVTLLHDLVACFDSDSLQCLAKVGLRHCLDAKYIVRVEDRFEVLCRQERALGETVELIAERVLLCDALDVLERLHNV